MVERKDLIRIQDAARELGVHRVTVRKYTKELKIPVYRFPNSRTQFIERKAFETLKQPKPVPS